MATVKEWVFENVSTAFVSIKVGDQVRGIAPGSVRPVAGFFRKTGGGADVEAARTNESVKGLTDHGALKMYERDTTLKVGNVGRVWNESDPEEVRVEKVLEHRRKIKEAARARPDAKAETKPAKPSKE